MNQLKQTKYPDFTITFDIANSIVDILIEHCGVAANRRNSIVEELMWQQLTEYRFQGELGFGGKLKHKHNKLYVDYYPEDKTTQREQMVQAANTKLEKIYKENKYESNNCRTN